MRGCTEKNVRNTFREAGRYDMVICFLFYKNCSVYWGISEKRRGYEDSVLNTVMLIQLWCTENRTGKFLEGGIYE